MKDLKTTSLRYDNDGLYILDQRKLPGEEHWHHCRDVDQLIGLIQGLAVRGAPLIGIAAALWVGHCARRGDSREQLTQTLSLLRASRPTAVNLLNYLDRLQTLINNMLGPESRPQHKLISIYEVLEHICKIVQAAEPERIEIHRDYDPSIPDLMADRDLLIQAFLNIARNAVQAIDGKGDITIKTRIDRNYSIGHTTHPLVVRIDIIDSGHGVSRELGETIFLPMITDKPDGSGLGLPIAQEIVSRHGGTIQMQSADTGTTFSTILPLEPS